MWLPRRRSVKPSIVLSPPVPRPPRSGISHHFLSPTNRGRQHRSECEISTEKQLRVDDFFEFSLESGGLVPQGLGEGGEQNGISIAPMLILEDRNNGRGMRNGARTIKTRPEQPTHGNGALARRPGAWALRPASPGLFECVEGACCNVVELGVQVSLEREELVTVDDWDWLPRWHHFVLLAWRRCGSLPN